MTEINTQMQTEIALIRADVNNVIDNSRKLEALLITVGEQSSNMHTMLTEHHIRLKAAESVMTDHSGRSSKTDETLLALNNALLQLKFDMQVERQSQHREVMDAITATNREATTEMDKKIDALATKVDKDMSVMNERVISLLRFKFMALGVGLIASVDMLMRIFGL